MKKAIALMLTAVVLIGTVFTGAVFAEGDGTTAPSVVANTLIGEYLNGYDEMNFSEWTNNVGGYTNSGSFVLDGREFKLNDDGVGYKYGKKSVYMKFKASDFADKNIASARLLIAYNGNFDNCPMNIYTFDADLWNTETAPIVNRDEKAVYFRTPAKVNGARVKVADENIDSTWEYYAAVDMTDVIKAAISENKEYIAFVLEPDSTAYGTFWKGDGTKPRLQIFTSSNNAPTATISISPEKDFYTSEDTITFTANGTDEDEGDNDSLTYTFYLDNNEVADGISGNVFTLANPAAGSYVIKVKVTDRWGDYGFAEKTITVKGAPVLTCNTVEGIFYNSYDEKIFTEYNNTTANSPYNYILGKASIGNLILYSKFDISKYTDENISTARLLTSMGGGQAGSTITLYGLNEWSDTTGPVVNRSDVNIIERKILPSTLAKIEGDENINSKWSYNTIFDFSAAVKKAVANGDKYVMFTIERTSNGYSTFGKATENRPRLQIFTTTNNIPVVTLKADKIKYSAGDTVVITADGTDADGDTVTYEFYVDGVLAETGVNENTLTIENYDGNEHIITVNCIDEWGDAGICTITLKKNMAYDISVKTSGSINGTLTADYTVQNMDDVNSLGISIIIAVYANDGSLYDTMFKTETVAPGAKVPFAARLTPKALTDGDFTGYTASTMIWTSSTLAPLGECVDFE